MHEAMFRENNKVHSGRTARFVIRTKFYCIFLHIFQYFAMVSVVKENCCNWSPRPF